jgi:hypothetical protein
MHLKTSIILIAILFLFPSSLHAYTPEAGVLHKYTKKYLLLIFNPSLPSGMTTISQFGWNDPASLVSQYVANINTVSHGIVQYQEAERLVVNAFPVKSDGFVYTPQEYINCWTSSDRARDCHNPDIINYNALIETYDICGKVNRGEIDEVFMFGGPYFGFYESIQAGQGAIWTNGPVVSNTSCNRIVDIMGFNYERSVAMMLEDLGHRIEGTMYHVYGGETSTYGQFRQYDQQNPGNAACGWMHYPANGQFDYDWSNTRSVQSTCKDWRDNYPNLTGQAETVSCANWSCYRDEGLAFKLMWFTSLPHAPGIAPDQKSANWWDYVVNLDDKSPFTRAVSSNKNGFLTWFKSTILNAFDFIHWRTHFTN